jgi:ribosomal 50S subunit-associated protein YjgA (DUF615 family)
MEKIDYKTIRENRSKMVAKSKLFEVSSKKIRTTMIGAIATIEENLGFLWGEGSEDQAEFKQIFEKMRSEILDRGNNQIRNLEAEFSNYDIVRKTIHIVLPVINKDQDDDR